MILVTGGTGFVGATLIRQLIAEGRHVRATKRAYSKIPADLERIPQIEWVNADMNNFFELEDAFDDIKQAYHCAAHISFNSSDKKRMMKVNVEGTAHFVNLCIENQVRLLYVSSIAAIGQPKIKGTPATEKDHWIYDGTQHAYSISKYEAEMEVWRGMEEGLNAVIINPSLIIGWQAGLEGSGAIFSLVDKGLSYYTRGSVGIVDVEDVARLAIFLMEGKGIQGKRFIINNCDLSYQDFLGKIAHYFGKKAPNKEAKPWMLGLAWRAAALLAYVRGSQPKLTKDTVAASLKRQAFSNAAIIRETGYQFKPLDKTIKEIASHFRTPS